MKDELYRLAWYMRGALSVNEAFQLSYEDRKIIGAIIKDNIENVKKTKLPIL